VNKYLQGIFCAGLIFPVLGSRHIRREMMKPDLPFYAMISVLIIYFAIVTVLSHWVKRRHPQAWDEKMGRFTLFLNNSIGSGWKSFRYLIFTNEHRELGDPIVNAFSNAARVVLGIFVICLIWNASLVR
jgi:hypothetical protein